jgi:signal transduction histidine kinase
MKNRHLWLLFLAAVVVIVGISLVTYRNLNNYIEEVRLVRHSHRVVMATQNVLASMIDAETGHRGFQLTRDSVFLQPFQEAVHMLPERLQRLDSLLAYNPSQKRKADTLHILVKTQFSLISQILANARSSSLYMDNFEKKLLLRAKNNMDAIRGVIRRILDEEENVVNSLTPVETQYRNTTPVSLLVYTLVALGGVSLLSVRILRSLQEQRAQQRVIEERGLLLREAEELANMGSWKWYEKSNHLIWSDGLYQIWGYRPHSFEPTWNSFQENVHPDDQKLVEDFLANVKNKKTESDLNFRIEIEGDIKYLLFVANAKEDDETKDMDILGTVIDVTAEKKAERDILIAERLSMTGKIARTIAHEVRNPLTSLNLALEQMKDEMPKDNESLKIYSDVIQRNASRIEQLIDEMLSSSKPRELNLELTTVEQMIKETIALAIDRLNLNEVRLETDYAPNLPRILLDREKIKIAFLNIVVNAVEAMEQGKGRLRITAGARDGFVIVTISDNGKGIAPKDIEKLFDPFFTAKQGGMGLGLTSTKNILTSHSATIEVSSKVNQGSTFFIYFKLPES